MQRYIAWAQRISPRLARALLDKFPAADERGMQVFSVDDPGLLTADKDVGAPEHGRPVTHWLTRASSLDGRIASGLWDSSAGRHQIKFDFDEWVQILEGEVDVTARGSTRRLRAGDVAFFRAGLSMTWDVPQYVRKVWVHRYPRAGLALRLARRVVRAVRPARLGG